jgi:hypothetical protein
MAKKIRECPGGVRDAERGNRRDPAVAIGGDGVGYGGGRTEVNGQMNRRTKQLTWAAMAPRSFRFECGPDPGEIVLDADGPASISIVERVEHRKCAHMRVQTEGIRDTLKL